MPLLSSFLVVGGEASRRRTCGCLPATQVSSAFPGPGVIVWFFAIGAAFFNGRGPFPDKKTLSFGSLLSSRPRSLLRRQVHRHPFGFLLPLGCSRGFPLTKALFPCGHVFPFVSFLSFLGTAVLSRAFFPPFPPGTRPSPFT